MKKLISVFSLTAALVLNSCSFLDVEPTIMTAGTSYQSSKDAQYALNGVYGILNSYQLYGQYYTLELSLNDDTCFYGSSNNTNILMMYTFDSGTKQIYDMWTMLYAGIRNANAFLEAIVRSECDKDNQMQAQARFLRAFYYYFLAQCWGDVPLRTVSTNNYEESQCKSTPQREVLDWVVKEMESSIQMRNNSLDGAPSAVTKTAMKGLLARVLLFKAGATVKGTSEDKFQDYRKAAALCKEVMESGLHTLNPDYSQVFINMIADVYDRIYFESMMEADFVGNRESADKWSNGRIGELNGLRSTGGTNYTDFKCNYSYGMFLTTPKIWDLYMSDDRTDDENNLSYITDERQEWNIPPYNYRGYSSSTHPLYPYGGDPTDVRELLASIDKCPYVYSSSDTNHDPCCLIAGRNSGKFRREVCYEGCQDSKRLYTQVNFPILRYSDVLLMYAEAVNESSAAPTQEAFDAVKQVRDRAGIGTKPFSEYSTTEKFREFVRNERGRELAFEAIRKYDLIRWGIFTESMQSLSEQAEDQRWNLDGSSRYCSQLGTRVQAKHILLPIPDLELGVNSLMQQNPLW